MAGKEKKGLNLDDEWKEEEGGLQENTSPGLEPTIALIPTPNGEKRVVITDPELSITEIEYNRDTVLNPQFASDLEREVEELNDRFKAEQNKSAKSAQAVSKGTRFEEWTYALDAYTDDFGKGNINSEKAIICALNYIAKELNAQYIGFTLNPHLKGKNPGLEGTFPNLKEWDKDKEYPSINLFVESDKSYSNERVKALFDKFKAYLKKKGTKKFVPQFNGDGEDDKLDIFTEPDKEEEDAAEPENERTLDLTEKIKFNVKLNPTTHDIDLMRRVDDFGEGYIAVKVEGNAKTIYLQPGNYVVGALSVIGNFDSDDEEFLTGHIRRLLDTFIVRILNLKVEGEGKLNKETNASVGGIDFNEAGSEFLKYHAGENLVKGEGDGLMILVDRKEAEKQEKRPNWKFYEKGSYFENEGIYNKIKDAVILFGLGFLGDAINEGIGGNTEDIRNRQYQNSVNFFKKHYKARPGITKATEHDAKRDSESAESLVKLVYGLFDQFGGEIARHGLSGEDADAETLKTASMFVAAFARAIKYMKVADSIYHISQIREKDDIKEMTSYFENLLVRINGEFSYGPPDNREPLMSRDGKKVSYLGRIITNIAHQIDPNKVSDFVVDMIEQAIEYEARVTPSTSHGFGDIQPIDAALREMYGGCIYKTINSDTQKEEKHIDQNKLRAVKMIDMLVNPKGKEVYRSFKPMLDRMLRQ